MRFKLAFGVPDTANVEKKISTEEHLKELFRNVYRIQELAGQITGQSSALAEISVNAAIAAGHTGGQSKVFSEIAKQIGVISALLVECIERLHKFTGPMAAQTLSALIRSGHSQKFQEVLPRVSGEKNRFTISGVIAAMDGAVAKLLERSEEQMASARMEEERMKLAVNRVWSIAIGLRISASMAEPAEQAFFLSIAEALEKMAADTAALVEDLVILVSAVERSLRERDRPEEDDEGELYAA